MSASTPPGEPSARPAADATLVRLPVVRLTAASGAAAPQPDLVAVEQPLELRVAGRAFTVLMRTPGDDEDLVRGFLLTEGLASGPWDIVRMSPGRPAAGGAGDVLDVELVPGLATDAHERSFYSSSSCGACGRRSLESLYLASGRIEDPVRVTRDVLSLLPARLRASQPTFGQSGGVHACALFDPAGRLEVLREDVGRHNAVDKVVGWAMAQGRLPLEGRVMMLSGRISFDLVDKAIIAGVPVLAAVGAPSSLAVQVATAHGLTLVGFVRPGSLNVYTHAERVVP